MTMRSIDFNLYLITDRHLFAHEALLFAAVEDALRAGVKAVQLREKDLETRGLLKMAYMMRDLTNRYQARLFINDRADIALCTGADGVHLGQASMPASAVRRVVGEGVLIGVSTHTSGEASAAEREGADFITFGPLYPTPSKFKYGAPVGVEQLRVVRADISIPIFGIGGLKPPHVAGVLSAGAHGVAVISGILGSAEVGTAAGQYLSVLGNG